MRGEEGTKRTLRGHISQLCGWLLKPEAISSTATLATLPRFRPASRCPLQQPSCTREYYAGFIYYPHAISYYIYIFRGTHAQACENATLQLCPRRNYILPDVSACTNSVGPTANRRVGGGEKPHARALHGITHAVLKREI